MRVFNPGLQFYVDGILRNDPFSFVRYGNGEWDCIFGTARITGSRSQTLDIPSLRKGMTRSIVNHRPGNYCYAMQSVSFLTKCGLLPKVEAWLRDNDSGIVWHDGEVFHKASARGRLLPMVEALRKYPFIAVGPKWLSSLPFPVSKHIVTDVNCWANVDNLFTRLEATPPGSVISFSAGPTTKVLIHRLYPLIGDSCYLIDFGSLWDVYCGVRSRTYHKRMSDEVISDNWQAPESGLQVLVLACGGDKKGWTVDRPKQMADIAGEPLILRTLRQLKVHGHEALVMTHKPVIQNVVPRYEVPEPRRFGTESLLSTRHSWRDRTIIFASDVVFSNPVIAMILADDDPLSVFGDDGEIFAIAFSKERWGQVVQALERATSKLETTGGPDYWWGFYRALCGFSDQIKHRFDDRIYKRIPEDDYTDDIDNQEKYQRVLKRMGKSAFTP